MKKLFMLLLVLAVFAVACGDDASDSSDDAAESPDGEAADTTTTEGTAEGSESTEGTTDTPRIVSLSPTATEILFAIGAGDQVVAVDAFSYYPEEAPVTDLDGFTPNAEAIASYDPQLVTMQANEAAADLEALGITVIQRDAPADFDGMYAQIEELGDATGHVEEADALVEEMQSEIAALQESAPDGTGLTYYHELGTDFYSVNSDTFIAQVYGLFGLESIGDGADGDAFSGYLPLTEEYILGSDPDLIFLADTQYADQTAEAVAERPGWADLTAVQTAAVVELDDDIASRWGPRVVDFAEDIAEAVTAVAPSS